MKVLALTVVALAGAGVLVSMGSDGARTTLATATKAVHDAVVSTASRTAPELKLADHARLCFADAQDQPVAINACVVHAALNDDKPEVFGQALRRAAVLQRDADPQAADASLLMAAAVTQDELPLLEFGAAKPADASDALVRREALFEAEARGAAQATLALKAYRQPYYGQSLSQPEVIIAISEGRGHELAQTMSAHRYVAGLAEGLIRTCPWQGPVWNGAGFKQSLEVFEAPLRANAHARLLGGLGDAASTAVGALGRFAKDMVHSGGDYQPAGTELLRGMRQAHRSLNAAASRGSETGARDGVRLAEIQGCATADALRFVRGLKAVFDERAHITPEPDLPVKR